MHLFGLHGYAKTTIKNVAEDAGLTSGAVYYYYPSKQHLLVALAESVAEQGASRLRVAAERHDRFTRRTDAIFDELARVHEESPDFARFILVLSTDVARYPELDHAYEAGNVAFGELCRWLTDEAIAAGDLHDDADRNGVVNLVAAVIGGVISMLATLPASHHDGLILAAKHLFKGSLLPVRR